MTVSREREPIQAVLKLITLNPFPRQESYRSSKMCATGSWSGEPRKCNTDRNILENCLPHSGRAMKSSEYYRMDQSIEFGQSTWDCAECAPKPSFWDHVVLKCSIKRVWNVNFSNYTEAKLWTTITPQRYTDRSFLTVTHLPLRARRTTRWTICCPNHPCWFSVRRDLLASAKVSLDWMVCLPFADWPVIDTLKGWTPWLREQLHDTRPLHDKAFSGWCSVQIQLQMYRVHRSTRLVMWRTKKRQGPFQWDTFEHKSIFYVGGSCHAFFQSGSIRHNLGRPWNK